MTIRTLVEVRGGRVSIVEDGNETQVTITRDDQAGPASLAGRIYTEAENQALEAQIHDLKNELNGVRGHSEGLEDRVRDLVAERDALLLKGEADRADDHNLVAAARVGRNAEKQRADENQAWAERTEALLENAQRDLNEISSKMARVGDKVWKGTLDFAMNHRGEPASIPVETVGDLANAVSAVRSIVGQP